MLESQYGNYCMDHMQDGGFGTLQYKSNGEVESDGEVENDGVGLLLRPIAICGKSGAGKSTIVKFIQSEYKGKFELVVSQTTRKPREGECDGVDYYFVSREDMARKIENGEFIESQSVHGNMYGTSFGEVERVMRSGKIGILDVDIQGLKMISRCSKIFDPLCLCIMPPTDEEQEKRLLERPIGPEGNRHDIRTRLRTSHSEENFLKNYRFDAIIVNDELEKKKMMMKSIINERYPNVNEIV